MADIDNFNEHRLAQYINKRDRRKGEERRKAFASYIEKERRSTSNRRGTCADRREKKTWLENTPS